MSFSRPKFTNAGRNLQLRSIGGTEICFTKMKIGSGEITEGQDFREFTDLIDPKATLSLTGIAIEDGYARVKGYFSNSGLEAFNYRELGLFAKDPDNPSNEILYCYANYGEDYAYIADPGSEIIERSVTIVAIVDDALNVTAVLDSSAVYVDQDDLDEAIALHNSDPYAHPDLRDASSLSAEVFVKPATIEDAETRDGSPDHPFKYIKEALDAFPSTSVSNLDVGIISDDDDDVLRWDADDSLDADDGANDIRGYQQFTIGMADGEAESVFLSCFLNFYSCNSVSISGLKTAIEKNSNYSSSANYGQPISITSAISVLLGVTLANGNETATNFLNWILLRKCGFVDIFVDQVDTSLSNPAFSIDGCELVKFEPSVSFTGVSKGITMESSFVITLCDVAATVPIVSATNCMYIDKTTALYLTNGTFKNHIGLTNNPHNVTLAQAMSAGGTVNVAHGGTGRTTLTSGAVLLGNGSNAIAQKTGTGAFYASTSGDPKFGTLPIAQGGTGRTDNGTYKNSSQSVNNSASRGYIEFPGTNGSKVLIQWGRCYKNGGGSGDYSQTFSKEFVNDNYSLITETGNWSHSVLTTKAKTGFKLTLTVNQTGSIAHESDDSFEWIAIGFC